MKRGKSCQKKLIRTLAFVTEHSDKLGLLIWLRVFNELPDDEMVRLIEAMSIHLYNAAKAHPNVDFVMVHMDLGTDNSQTLDLLGRLPNLYGDTSGFP